MSHLCHWPGCKREVPPELYACKLHWFALPKYIRDAIWEWYVPGQEIRKDPTEEYIEVARIAEAWVNLCGNGYPLTRVGLEAIRERAQIDADFKARLPFRRAH